MDVTHVFVLIHIDSRFIKLHRVGLILTFEGKGDLKSFGNLWHCLAKHRGTPGKVFVKVHISQM